MAEKKEKKKSKVFIAIVGLFLSVKAVALRIWYFPRWRIRSVGLFFYRDKNKAGQTHNMKGVILPNGEFVLYGTFKYRFMWFSGKII